MPLSRFCLTVLSLLLLWPCSVLADENSAVASSFTMEEAVLRALQANPNVEASQHSVEAAESAIKVARSNFGPTVDASYGFTYYDEDRPSRNERRAFTAGITASQPLFAGFELLNTYQKAELQKDYQDLQLQNDCLNIVRQVQIQFLNYLRAEENIRSSIRSMARAKEQMAMAQAAFDVGLRPRLDLIQATLELTRSEAGLIQSENARDLCRAQLNTLLKLPVSSETSFIGELNPVAFERDLQSCLEQAFRHRPDLLMAAKSVEMAYKDLGVVRSAFYPRVSLALNWNSTGNDLTAAGGKYNSTDYSALNAGITLRWNLFSSGRYTFQSQQVKSQIAALESQGQAAFDNSAYEVRAGLLNMQDALRSIDVAERSLLSAEESYDNARMLYELQLGTNLDLLSAQEALGDAELALISAKADYLSSLATLYVSMGEINPDLQAEGTINPDLQPE